MLASNGGRRIWCRVILMSSCGVNVSEAHLILHISTFCATYQNATPAKCHPVYLKRPFVWPPKRTFSAKYGPFLVSWYLKYLHINCDPMRCYGLRLPQHLLAPKCGSHVVQCLYAHIYTCSHMLHNLLLQIRHTTTCGTGPATMSSLCLTYRYLKNASLPG